MATITLLKICYNLLMATEYFDVLDENGYKTGRTKPRDAVHRDGDWHAAVNIFVLNPQNEVLLQRRAPNKDSYPNMWDLSCGGHVTAGEDYQAAAIRELKEELGLVVDPEDLIELGKFKTSSRPRPDFINNSIEKVYLLRTTRKLEDFTIQEDELSAIKYVPWRELRTMIENPQLSNILRHRQQYAALFKTLEQAG